MSEKQTLTLTDFLLARIDEDEDEAKAAMGPANSPMGDDAADEVLWMARNEGVAEAGIEHFARHDPARVLAECEAKRRIVEAHGPYRMASLGYCSSCGDVPQVAYPCPTLRALAAIYADHPDYRVEWRP